MNKSIAIQGIRGSFHHQVAQEYFNPKIEVVECMSFDGSVDKLVNGKTDTIVMALLQCKMFLKKYPHIKLVEAKDTADVAKQIFEEKKRGIAAIASKNAAKMYQLNILAEGIQIIKHNETRFVIVKRQNHQVERKGLNKASLKFELDHKRGSLATILNVMSDCKLNLTKIQSLPKIETPWKYVFFVDITFNDYEDYEKAHSIIQIMAENFKVLGEYKNAKL